MKVALIIENSQAAKSDIIHDALVSVAKPLGHEVFPRSVNVAIAGQ